MEKLLCCVSSLSTFRADRYEKCSKVVRIAAQLESKLSSVDHLILKCRRTSPRKETSSRMVEKDVVTTLGFLMSLKTLHLEGFHQLKLDKRSISSVRKLTLHKCLPVDLIAISKSFEQLEELHISQCTVTAKHVKNQEPQESHKGISPNLHTLVLVHSDVKAQALPFYEGLRHCNLSFCHLEEDALVNMLGKIKDSSLTHLNLSCEMHARLNLTYNIMFVHLLKINKGYVIYGISVSGIYDRIRDIIYLPSTLRMGLSKYMHDCMKYDTCVIFLDKYYNSMGKCLTFTAEIGRSTQLFYVAHTFLCFCDFMDFSSCSVFLQMVSLYPAPLCMFDMQNYKH